VVKLGALGDVHGDFASVRAIASRHPDIGLWVSVGDLGDGQGRYEPMPFPLYWIKGNNDNLEVIAGIVAGERHIPNLHHVPNGVVVAVGPIRVVGLGGTLAPTWYDKAPHELPRPRLPAFGPDVYPPLARDDKRRHFVRAEVEACKRQSGVELLLTHEAARPFYVEVRGRMHDVGKTPINDILATMHPRLHLSGHHHQYSDEVRQGVRSIGLDPVSTSYLIVDLDTWKYERVET
jgi:Icc-related predicted phosphoesterase